MTLKEFMEQYDRSPADRRRIVEAASCVTDFPHLRDAAQRLLSAEQYYLATLEGIGFEHG